MNRSSFLEITIKSLNTTLNQHPYLRTSDNSFSADHYPRILSSKDAASLLSLIFVKSILPRNRLIKMPAISQNGPRQCKCVLCRSENDGVPCDHEGKAYFLCSECRSAYNKWNQRKQTSQKGPKPKPGHTCKHGPLLKDQESGSSRFQQLEPDGTEPIAYEGYGG